MNALSPMQVKQCLLAGNWNELVRHFSFQPPTCAEEYHARALMNLHPSDGTIDWPSVIADMREACALNPGDLFLSVNLSQALLDSKQPQEAYEIARQTSEFHPQAYPAMEKLAAAAFATQRWAEAYGVIQHARDQLGQNLPLQSARLQDELASRWWEPMVKGGVVLRSPDPSDVSYLSSTFRNEKFMLHYHRFQGASEEAVENYISIAKLHPRQSRRTDWIILDRSCNRVGLAAIVDIDWGNERGELLVGLPGNRTQAISLKASVAILEFAFERLRLAKIMSYVYADNPEAQANTLHLGFEQEGLLRSHIASPSGRIDLFVNGLTHAGFKGNVLLNKLVHRWSQRAMMD